MIALILPVARFWIILLGVLSTMLVCPRVSWSEQKIKTYSVDLSGTRSLKPLFAAGLRPKLIPGIRSTCEIRNQRIAIQFVPNQTPITMDVEYLNVLVGAENQVRGFELRGSEKMSQGAAAAEVERVIQLLDFPQKAQDDLDTWMSKYRGKWSFLPYRGGGNTGHSMVAVEIMPSFVPEAPAVIGFHGRRNGADKEKSRRIPVEPPPGYEDVSMNYPGNERRGEFTVVDGTSLEGASRSAPKEPTQPEPEKESASNLLVGEDTSATPRRSNTGLVVGLLVGALALLGGAWLVLRRKSS